MKNAAKSRLFLPFLLLIFIILAVLGFGIGQLFPYYIDTFLEEANDKTIETLEETIRTNEMSITTEEKQALVESIHADQYADQTKELKMRIGFGLFIFLVLAFFALTYSVYKVLMNFVEPIENVTKTAHQLSIGNFQARAFAKGPRTITNLRNAVNILASNLQDITKKRVIEEERLQTLIQNMGSGLLMIDRAGEVIIANHTFLKRFNYLADDVIGKTIMSLQLPEELKQFIDQVFLTEVPEHKQLQMTIDHEIVQKMAYGAPVIGEHGKWHGVVIVLHDISELVRLEQIRKDFVANVSHELRTPITSVKGFAETLLDGAYKDEKMAYSFLEIILAESNRLQELITDLLELSKIEQHGFSLALEPVILEEVVKHIEKVVQQKIKEKNIQFNLQMEQDYIVNGELNRLIQIFTNLVYNSIMYSPMNTTITLKVERRGEFAIVDVIDQGIGIEKAEIARIFERFYRVDRARSRDSGGTGLGLAIVKHLVEAHDGKIKVTSELGKGTTIRIYLPLA